MADEKEKRAWLWRCTSEECQDDPCILMAYGEITCPPLTCPWSKWDSERSCKTVEWEEIVDPEAKK